MPARPSINRITQISSTQNEHVKALLRLTRASIRRSTGKICVEGEDEITLAMQSRSNLLELYYCPALISDSSMPLLQAALQSDASIFEVTAPVFRKFAYRQNPDGWYAVMSRFTTELDELPLSENPLIVICASVEKPGNLGAILRTADAAGVDAVISTEPVTDWGNPNTIRSSRGSVFTVPVAETSSEVLLPWLRERGIRLLATSPNGDVNYTEADLTKPIAILLGSEPFGLPNEWMEAADAQVRIPMVGKVDSLNVSVSAALLIYEAFRQRTSH